MFLTFSTSEGTSQKCRSVKNLYDCLTSNLKNYSQNKVAINDFSITDHNEQTQKFDLQKIRIGDIGIERSDVAVAFCRYVGILVDENQNLAAEMGDSSSREKYVKEIVNLLESFARNMAGSDIWVVWRKERNDGFSFHDNLNEVARDLWEEFVMVF